MRFPVPSEHQVGRQILQRKRVGDARSLVTEMPSIRDYRADAIDRLREVLQ